MRYKKKIFRYMFLFIIFAAFLNFYYFGSSREINLNNQNLLAASPGGTGGGVHVYYECHRDTCDEFNYTIVKTNDVENLNLADSTDWSIRNGEPWFDCDIQFTKKKANEPNSLDKGFCWDGPNIITRKYTRKIAQKYCSASLSFFDETFYSEKKEVVTERTASNNYTMVNCVEKRQQCSDIAPQQACTAAGCRYESGKCTDNKNMVDILDDVKLEVNQDHSFANIKSCSFSPDIDLKQMPSLKNIGKAAATLTISVNKCTFKATETGNYFVYIQEIQGSTIFKYTISVSNLKDVSGGTTTKTNACVGEKYVVLNPDPALGGISIGCGDKVIVKECEITQKNQSVSVITSINGVSITPEKIFTSLLTDKQPSCSILRYSTIGAEYYSSLDDLLDPNISPKYLECNTTLEFVQNPEIACTFGEPKEGVYPFCSVKNTKTNKTIIANRYYMSYTPVDESLCRMGNTSTPPTTPTTKTTQSITTAKPGTQSTTPTTKTTQSITTAKPGTQPITTTAKPNETTTGCLPQEPLKNQTSYEEKVLPVCYTYENNIPKVVGPDEKERFTCAKGYRRIVREDLVNGTCNKLKSSSEKQSCYKAFIYSCLSVTRPKVHGTGSLATPDGVGSITIKGYDSTTNTGLKGFVINYGEKPIGNLEWEPYPNSAYETSKTKYAGTYFAWTMTNDRAISYPIMLNIYSDDITTTVQGIDIKDPNSDTTIPYSSVKIDDTLAYNRGITSSDYVRLSNNLVNDSMLASGFDMFITAYELTVDSDKIALYATLTSADSRYVEGFEPRTVDLDYGRNVVLIKIVNNNGKERTYTFIINRTDNRESVNILKTLTTSVGNLTFDPYVSDYTVSVPKNTTSVDINGTLESYKSAFIRGYEPRNVELTNDITSAVLKTISEAGITRNYVITFIKTGAERKDDLTNSTYLSSLTIPGTEIMFDRNTLSYTVAVDYEVEIVPVYAFAESENATVETSGNIGLKVGANKIEIVVTNGSQVKIYNVFINRKEDGLEVSSDTRLKTLTVKDYNLKFNEDVNDYTLKIKREKTLLLTATPQSNRSEVYMYGNNALTAFSTIRVKVIAENGDTGLYSVDIIKDIYNKKLETTIAIVGSIILLGGGIIVTIRKKHKSLKDYIEE